MKDNAFQLVLIGVFALFAVGGLIGFALYKGSSEPVAELSVWGELPQSAFADVREANPELIEGYRFTYTYVDPLDFDARLTDALSSGTGPDLVLMSSERLYKHRARLIPISYEFLQVDDFREEYLTQATDVYVGKNGLWGLPIAVDPLVLYWNETLLRNSAVLQAPRTWDEVPGIVERVVVRGPSGEIVTATLPLGSFSNVKSAKAILSSLFLQAGSPITVMTDRGLESNLRAESGGIVGAQYGLSFFTEFADPLKSLYTWNSVLSDAETMFVGGRLALYPAFASDKNALLEKNPNLDIRVARFPQSSASQGQTVFARFYGVSVTRQAERKYESALHAARLLSADDTTELFSSALSLAPARKSLYPYPADASAETKVVYDSAIISSTWIDPDPEGTEQIFQNMTEAVTSGRSRVTEALSNADYSLSGLTY